MAYRFAVEGVAVECDTAAEAAELIVAVASRRQAPKGANGHAPREHEKPAETKKKSGFSNFWAALTQQQQVFLKAIADSHPKPILTEDLAGVCGVEFKDAGWVRRKIDALAVSLGIEPDALYSVERVMVEGKPRRAYLAKGLLREGIEGAATSASK
jgi:hypothetical protein